jgi:UPF0271 protein
MSTSTGQTVIDLNADLGEGAAQDEKLLALVTSANIACGAHAGDPESILRTLEMARARGVAVGAHPGFADRASFGRREMPATHDGVADMVRNQLTDLARLTRQAGVVLRFLKAHGALYNQAQRDRAVAAGVVEAGLPLGLPVLGMPGSEMQRLAHAASLRFIPEGFPDRRYTDDGRLVPRSEPGAVLDDPSQIRDHLLRLLETGIETVCVHGDRPDAVALAELVRSTLEKEGLKIGPFC